MAKKWGPIHSRRVQSVCARVPCSPLGPCAPRPVPRSPLGPCAPNVLSPHPTDYTKQPRPKEPRALGSTKKKGLGGSPRRRPAFSTHRWKSGIAPEEWGPIDSECSETCSYHLSGRHFSTATLCQISASVIPFIPDGGFKLAITPPRNLLDTRGWAPRKARVHIWGGRHHPCTCSTSPS